MPKNIVLCCDGTGNQFGTEISNVVKLYKVLGCNADQIAYYHPGVGTMGARNALTTIGKLWTQLIGLAFGYGISDNIADAYQFLMRTYETGDRIYVFGFSRGAYTARALCGMLRAVGVLSRWNEALIPYAIRLLKQRPIPFDVAAAFKGTFSQECRVHFLGLWDTVSSVGWVYDPVHFPFTSTNPDFNIVRHAISIDERRAFFRQNLFVPISSEQDIQQVWFAGVHSDVGGSYPESESQLSKISLQWMLSEAELAGLAVDQSSKAQILGSAPNARFVAPDAKGMQHESLKGAWWIAEVWPKIVRVREQTSESVWHSKIRLNVGRARCVPQGSLLHVSVEERMDSVNYQPKNLVPRSEFPTCYRFVSTPPS